MEITGIAALAGWIDCRAMPLLASVPGRLFLGLDVAAGVAALLAGRPTGPTVSPYAAVDALGSRWYRRCCTSSAMRSRSLHYGRRPRRAGFGSYWGELSFYVDSTEALTLPSRARVVQALAGLAVDVVRTMIVLHQPRQPGHRNACARGIGSRKFSAAVSPGSASSPGRPRRAGRRSAGAAPVRVRRPGKGDRHEYRLSTSFGWHPSARSPPPPTSGSRH